MHGLGTFADEYVNTVEMEIDGIVLRVLSLERILDSKRSARRVNDLASIPALEEALVARRG